MLETMLCLNGGGGPTGQMMFDKVGTTLWEVPKDVTTICAVVVGGGGGAGKYSGPPSGSGMYVYGSGGGGGGLSWRNNIPVTPGETLTIVVGAAGANNYTINAYAEAGGDSAIRRDGATLCIAKGGHPGQNYNVVGGGGGLGGKAADPINDGGGNGGNGGNGTLGSNAGGSGGAAGYSGNGGNGASSWGSGWGGSGGGGGGGGANKTGGTGGGVQPYGEGINGYGGSTGSAGYGGSPLDGQQAMRPWYGAGGSTSGVVRIIWGSGRAFPKTGTKDK